MTYTVFTGCSVTEGWSRELVRRESAIQDPDLWVNLLHQQNEFLSQTELINLGSAGKSNINIFLDTVNAILNYENLKYVVVQWTGAPRYEINLGFELYSTLGHFIRNSDPYLDFKLNDITFSKKWLEDFNEKLTSLSHLHFEILEVIKYTNHLINIAKLKNIKIFFLAVPAIWDNDYFTKIDLDKNFDITKLTPLTQKLLNVHNRDDGEILKLYNKMHDDYDQAGGIQLDHWCLLGYQTHEYNAKISRAADSHWLPKTHPYVAKLCSDKINAKLLK